MSKYVNTKKQTCQTMTVKIPLVKIPCADGSQLSITELPDAMLVDAYLQHGVDEDAVDVVRLLRYALAPVDDRMRKAGAVLRKCLVGGKSLLVVYPSLDEDAPKGAQLLGDIPDGGLYLV